MSQIPIETKTVNAFVKRLLSIKDLVVEMGATEWFWRSQIWDGKLKYVQVGKKMFVDREDVESFIQSNKFKHGSST